LRQAFLKDVIKRLEKTGVTYAITGSIASNYWGIPRTTHDVDIVIVLRRSQVQLIVSALSDPYYLSELAVKDAVSSGTMFNIIDTSTGFKADFWISKGDLFDQSMLQRRRREKLIRGQPAYVGSPEDVLLHKLVWYKNTVRQAAGRRYRYRQRPEGQSRPSLHAYLGRQTVHERSVGGRAPRQIS
jgi:hypothetical protein